MKRNARARAIHVFGDSTCLIYHDLLFVDSEPAHPFVLHSMYALGMRTAEFTDASNALDPRVLYPLLAAGVLIGDPTDWSAQRRRAVSAEFTRVAGSMDRDAKAGLDEGLLDPTLVLTLGTIDVRTIVGQLGNDVDFPYTSARWKKLPDPDKTIVPQALVLELVERAIAPYIDGLHAMKASGLERIFVHDVQPPSTDTGPLGEQVFGTSDIDLRYKVTLQFNERLIQRCRERGIATIEIWDDVVGPDGYLKPNFVLDAGHLNIRAVDITIRKLAEDLARLE